MMYKKAQNGDTLATRSKRISKPFKSELGKPMTAAQKRKQQLDELKMIDYPGRPAMPEINYKGGPKVKKKMKSGGKTSLGMKSVKAGFDKNPGVTRADIIVAAKKEAKYGKKVKKAQDGTDVELRSGQMRRLGRLSAKNPMRAKKVAKRIVERATRERRGQEYLKKNVSKFMPKVPEVKAKRGASVKGKMGKCRYGCK